MVEAHYQLPSISYLPILLPIPYQVLLLPLYSGMGGFPRIEGGGSGYR